MSNNLNLRNIDVDEDMRIIGETNAQMEYYTKEELKKYMRTKSIVICERNADDMKRFYDALIE